MATIRKVTRKSRGKEYEYFAVSFTDPGTGKEKLRYFASRKEAQKVRTELETRVTGGTYSDESHKVTVSIIAKRWRAADYSPTRTDVLRSTTASDYELLLNKYVLPRWGAVRLIDIRAGMVEIWRNDLIKDGVGASTVRKALLVLGILFRFAMRDHIVTHDPTAHVKKPTVRKRKEKEERLTPEQLGKLFTVVKGCPRIIIRVAAGTGMREGEIFGLQWKNVDLKGRMILVERQYTHGEFVPHAKTDAGYRQIGIDAKLAAELSEWKLAQKPEHRRDESLVCGNKAGGPMSAANFMKRHFYPALERAGLPRVIFHSLRHTAATILISSNTPPGTVHRVMGHASFSTTLKLYGGVTDEALGKAAGTMGDAFEPTPDKLRTNASEIVEIPRVTH